MSLKFFEERYLSYFLYNAPTNVFVFNDERVQFLEMHRFNIVLY